MTYDCYIFTINLDICRYLLNILLIISINFVAPFKAELLQELWNFVPLVLPEQ